MQYKNLCKKRFFIFTRPKSAILALMSMSNKPSLLLYIAIALAIIVGIPYLFFYSWISGVGTPGVSLFYEFFRSLIFFIPVLLIILIAFAAYKFSKKR